ncbi:BAG family molecular chaperone regulator 4, partial [Cucurbita argyrosperma subsp. sororia]
MKTSSSKSIPSSDEFRQDIDWELRPGGMIVQKRHIGSGSDRFITIKISHGSCHHLLTVDAHSTFGHLKRLLRQKTGLEPTEQRLLFRGKEKENDECLHMAGVNDMSKVVLMEDPASKERKLEINKRTTTAVGHALAEITAEVDKLFQKVAAVEGAVIGGRTVEEKEVNGLIDMLMMQLLKLDAIEIDGDAKLLRTQVVRVQNYVDRLDNVKNRRNSNGLRIECGFGTLIPPITCTKITHDWELFD